MWGWGWGTGDPGAPGGRGGQERWRAPLRKVGLWNRDGAVPGGFSAKQVTRGLRREGGWIAVNGR